MNTVLFVNATIGFSENLFLVYSLLVSRKTSSNNSSSFIGRMVAVLDIPVNRIKMILCLQIRYTMFIKTLNTKPFIFTEDI